MMTAWGEPNLRGGLDNPLITAALVNAMMVEQTIIQHSSPT